MIIAIDGYDGTGKTTLAKKLSKEFNFNYVENPLIYMLQSKHKYSIPQAKAVAYQINNKLFTSKNRQNIARFYCNTLLWLKQFEDQYNIVLDKGFLSMYAVVGFPETKDIFVEYLNKGIFFSASIYLKATDQERITRIRKRNPHDPDLQFPTEWHKNDLEDFANSHKLNYKIINTNDKSIDQVYEEAKIFFIKETNQNSLESNSPM